MLQIVQHNRDYEQEEDKWLGDISHTHIYIHIKSQYQVVKKIKNTPPPQKKICVINCDNEKLVVIQLVYFIK